MKTSSRSLTLSDIAELTEVTPAAVSNWRRRHADFPSSTIVGGQEQFSTSQVAHWLDGRKIPANARNPDESAGTTYGDRFKRNAAFPGQAAHPADHHQGSDIGVSAELDLWSLYDRLRGLMPVSAFGDLLLSLLYLCGRHPAAWDELLHDSHVTPGRVVELLHSVLPEASWNQRLPTAALAEFPRHRSDDLARIIRLVDGIGGIERPRGAVCAVAFDKVLRRMAIADGRKGGEFQTPESIVQLAVRLTKPSASDRILDPWCRAGQFLAAAVDAARTAGQFQHHLAVSGSDPNVQNCRWAYMGLHLKGVEADIRLGQIGSLLALGSGSEHDVVMTNPPFNVSHWSGESPKFGSWPYGPPPEHNANFAFLQIAVTSLNKNGRAAVVMTNGAGTSQNVHERQIRAAMVEAGVVKAVIALPGHLFSSTTIPVSMWLLEPPNAHPRTDVFFVDATGMGYMQERNLRSLSGADVDQIADAMDLWRESGHVSLPAFARNVGLERLRESDYRLNPREYVLPEAITFDAAAVVDDVHRLRRRLDHLRDACALADEELDRRLKGIVL